MIVEYFINSKNLACVFHLLDSRHKPSEEDIMMNEFLNYYKIPFYVILTKTDKISKNELSKNQKKIENLLDLSFNLGIISYSIISKKNKNFILDKIINI